MWILYVILGIIAFLIILYLIIIFLIFGFATSRFNKIKTIENDKILSQETKEKVKKSMLFLENVKKEEVSILSDDNLKLYGNLYQIDNPRACIILFHGWKTYGLYDFLQFTEFLIRNNINVLIVTQRAHQQSEGKRIGFGILERYDVKNWVKFVENKYPNLPIIIEGISMGCSSVLYASNLELSNNVKFIIGDCGFTSPYDEFEYLCKKYKAPYKLILPGVRLVFKLFAHYEIKTNTKSCLEHSKYPILFIHGKSDTFVPFYMGEENFNACKSEKEMLSVEDAEHGLSYIVQKEMCERVILAWIEKYC